MPPACLSARLCVAQSLIWDLGAFSPLWCLPAVCCTLSPTVRRTLSLTWSPGLFHPVYFILSLTLSRALSPSLSPAFALSPVRLNGNCVPHFVSQLTSCFCVFHYCNISHTLSSICLPLCPPLCLNVHGFVCQLVFHFVSQLVSRFVPHLVPSFALSPTWSLTVSPVSASLFPTCLLLVALSIAPRVSILPPFVSQLRTFVLQFVPWLISQRTSCFAFHFASHIVSQLVFHFAPHPASCFASMFVSSFVSRFVPHFVSRLVFGFVSSIFHCGPALSLTLSISRIVPALSQTLPLPMPSSLPPKLSLLRPLLCLSLCLRFGCQLVLGFCVSYYCTVYPRVSCCCPPPHHVARFVSHIASSLFLPPCLQLCPLLCLKRCPPLCRPLGLSYCLRVQS